MRRAFRNPIIDYRPTIEDVEAWVGSDVRVQAITRDGREFEFEGEITRTGTFNRPEHGIKRKHVRRHRSRRKSGPPNPGFWFFDQDDKDRKVSYSIKNEQWYLAMYDVDLGRKVMLPATVEILEENPMKRRRRNPCIGLHLHSDDFEPFMEAMDKRMSLSPIQEEVVLMEMEREDNPRRQSSWRDFKYFDWIDVGKILRSPEKFYTSYDYSTDIEGTYSIRQVGASYVVFHHFDGGEMEEVGSKRSLSAAKNLAEINHAILTNPRRRFI